MGAGKVLTNPSIQNMFAPVTTATAASGAATANGTCVQVTSESLSTAAAAEYTLTLTNSKIAAASIVLVSCGKGSATQGTPAIGGVTPAAGSAVITVTNVHASEAFNGTIKVNALVINPA